jgi:hypothetical protein
MSIKLKVLGLGILAVMATSAFAVLNASASTPASSHFVADPPQHSEGGDPPTHLLNVEGVEEYDPADPEGKPHNLSFFRTNADTTTVSGAEPIKCTKATYHGQVTGSAATTTQALQVRPAYSQCSTRGAAEHNVTVHVPESCGTNVYEFTSGNPGTIHVNCPITVTHPNCTIRMPAQTVSGATYTQINEGGKHAITVDINVQHITGHFEGGICIFLGTSHRFEMIGSATVRGRDFEGNQVNVTHTE